MTLQETRRDAVNAAVEQIRAIVGAAPPDRQRLAMALSELQGLAARAEFWSEAEFPPPDEATRQARYLIREDEDHSLALYLNVMLPGRRIPPHNHTTWACVAGIAGEEYNQVYRRVDDGATPGHARLEPAELVVVGPDRGIALLPDDIHSVEIRGGTPIRHLHMYGKALETLSERLAFDLESQTCKPMPMTVQTRR